MHLVQLWTQDHNLQLEHWLEYQQEAAEAAEEAERQWQATEDEARALAEQVAEREQIEAEKKKPKIGDFDESKQIPNVLLPHPSQYAIQKFKQFEYVELWYFSPDGYHEATRESCSTADDALGIAKSDEVLTLKSVASIKASKNALLDHELPMMDFLQAKNTFLQQAKLASWPEKHLNALLLFYWNLENHSIRSVARGDEIILTYASRICRHWHDDLKTGTAGNIAVINAHLIQTIGFEVNTRCQDEIAKCHEEQLSKVHPNYPPNFSPLTDNPASVIPAAFTIFLHASHTPTWLQHVHLHATPGCLKHVASTATAHGLHLVPCTLLRPLQNRATSELV